MFPPLSTMAKPDYLYLAATIFGVASLVGLITNGTGLLGSPIFLTPGLIAWPGLDLPLSIAGFVASAAGLATVYGLLRRRIWAPKVGAVLGAVGMIVGLLATLLMPALKDWHYPFNEMLGWSVAVVASLWLVHFCTMREVVDAFAEEEVFPSTREAPPDQPEAAE